MLLREFERVKLLVHIPPMLRAGTIGSVAHVYNEGEGYEVEFYGEGGETAAVSTVLPSQIERVIDHPVCAVLTQKRGEGYGGWLVRDPEGSSQLTYSLKNYADKQAAIDGLKEQAAHWGVEITKWHLYSSYNDYPISADSELGLMKLKIWGGYVKAKNCSATGTQPLTVIAETREAAIAIGVALSKQSSFRPEEGWYEWKADVTEVTKDQLMRFLGGQNYGKSIFT